jgi:hypothetical protein
MRMRELGWIFIFSISFLLGYLGNNHMNLDLFADGVEWEHFLLWLEEEEPKLIFQREVERFRKMMDNSLMNIRSSLMAAAMSETDVLIGSISYVEYVQGRALTMPENSLSRQALLQVVQEKKLELKQELSHFKIMGPYPDVLPIFIITFTCCVVLVLWISIQ